MFRFRRYLIWLRIILYCLLVSLCTVTACVPAALSISSVAAQPETAVRYTEAACRFPLPEGKIVECGDLEVPEAYENPHGRHIHLHVAIIKSSSETPAPDPLIILYGGPGAYALDRLDKTIERFAGVLSARDIILYDQRGIGYSQPSLNCPELDSFDVRVIDEQLDEDQEFARRLAAYGRCRERLMAEGYDLRNYSADTLAADAASLRQVLGYDAWNLYGVSYGARQALMIMRDYPTGLRSVVLDSVYPLNIDLAKENAITNAYALDTLFAANEAAHPEFEEAFFSLVNALDRSPVNVPALIPNRWILPYQSFNGDDLLRMMISIAGRWPQSFSHMPGFIEDIADGNYVALIELAKPCVGDQLFSEGMNLSVVCQEIDPAARRSLGDTGLEMEPRVYEFAMADVAQRRALCALWLGRDWELRPQAPVVSDIPALVLRGEQDVLIPAAWDRQAAQRLANSFHLTFAKTGHGVMNTDACAREAVAAFLIDPAVMPDSGCLK